MPTATRRKPATKMTADEILAELAEIAPPIEEAETTAKTLIARRLELWVAARMLPKSERPIFVTLATASDRSEALVIRHTGKWFEKQGIDPKSFDG